MRAARLPFEAKYGFKVHCKIDISHGYLQL